MISPQALVGSSVGGIVRGLGLQATPTAPVALCMIPTRALPICAISSLTPKILKIGARWECTSASFVHQAGD